MLAVGIVVGTALRETSVGALFQFRGALHAPAHIALFSVLTVLLMGCTPSWRSRWVLCLGALLLGLGTEYYEGWLDKGGTEVTDVLADSLGIALGLLSTVRTRAAWRSQ